MCFFPCIVATYFTFSRRTDSLADPPAPLQRLFTQENSDSVRDDFLLSFPRWKGKKNEGFTLGIRYVVGCLGAGGSESSGVLPHPREPRFPILSRNRREQRRVRADRTRILARRVPGHERRVCAVRPVDQRSRPSPEVLASGEASRRDGASSRHGYHLCRRVCILRLARHTEYELGFPFADGSGMGVGGFRSGPTDVSLGESLRTSLQPETQGLADPFQLPGRLCRRASDGRIRHQRALCVPGDRDVRQIGARPLDALHFAEGNGRRLARFRETHGAFLHGHLSRNEPCRWPHDIGRRLSEKCERVRLPRYVRQLLGVDFQRHPRTVRGETRTTRPSRPGRCVGQRCPELQGDL